MASTRVAVFLTLAACVSGSQYYRDHPPPPPHEVTYSTPGYSYSPPPPPPPPQYGPPPPAYNGAPKYKREAYPGDPYYGKPTRPDYGGESSSSSSGYDDKKSGYGDKGIYVDTSLYWNPTNFVEYVYTLKGKDGGTYEPSKPWKADCNGYSYGYKYGWITAIWDDYDFKGIDYLKCAGPKSDSEYDKYYERYGGYKLDLYDAKVIEFPGKDYKPDYKPDAYGKSSSYKPNECHKGYLLTALWSDYDFKTVKYGKCVRLDYGLVDYSTCDNIATDYKSGGTYEAGKRWNLECPVEWAAVGLKQGYDKIEYVRCCKLIPPHPPAKAYEHY